ncbi:MAG: hypothetical protein J6X44_02680 [Thermoguttaceae bacterium]|nr:hypothetical protein [Thermoguttaceae bacterium]
MIAKRLRALYVIQEIGMILAGILIIIFSIVLIKNARRREKLERVWLNCSERAVSLAYQAQVCFARRQCQNVYVCYSEETRSFWVERESSRDSLTRSVRLNRRDSFEKHCVEIESFILTSLSRND